MKKIIIILALLLLVSFASAQDEKVFSVVMTTDGQNLEFDDVGIFFADQPVQEIDDVDNFVANLMSFGGETLSSTSFSNDISISPNDETTLPLQEFTFNLEFPYSREAKEIVIMDKNTRRVMQSIDLSHLQFCNFNGFCDLDEDKELCPEDCDFGKQIKIGNIAQENASQQNKTVVRVNEVVEQPSRSREWILLVLILIIFLVIVTIVLRRKK